jgi:hypothetical protein
MKHLNTALILIAFVAMTAFSIVQAQQARTVELAQAFKTFDLPLTGQFSGMGVTTMPDGQTVGFPIKPSCGSVPIVKGIQGFPSNPSVTTAQCKMTVTADRLNEAEIIYDCGAAISTFNWRRTGDFFVITSTMTGTQLRGQTIVNRMELFWESQCSEPPIAADQKLTQKLEAQGQKRYTDLNAYYQKEKLKPNFVTTVLPYLERTRVSLRCEEFYPR